ncbi:MAG: hypothetical protein ABSF56_01195 [Minisyncoccia bacterium]|jgi:hypothetical protein
MTTSLQRHSNKTKGILVLILAVVFLFYGARENQVSAQVKENPATVPIGTGWDPNSIMADMKNFILDKLASTVAKQILQQMTVATINWINSGFNGSPAFLTNPEGFFLDTADQITGAMIAESGPLQKLCSPWNVDIRLSLALLQTQPLSQRYICTLSTVINNASNATIGGHSIQGFVRGDFSQGGWPAFISMTTEPQNNPYGIYLQAHSDILSAVGAKQSFINQDLLQGHGFLSWKSCKNVQVSALDANQAIFGSASVLGSSGNTSDNNGSVLQTVQQCETETPGSVIENSLAEHLGTGVRELELANDINSVVNALVSQLVSQMLTKGLRSLSAGGSGLSGNGLSSLNSYTSQLQADATAQKSVPNVASTGFGSSSSAESTYDQAIGLITDSKDRYETARSCFTNKPDYAAAPSAYSAVLAIDNTVETSIDPLLTNLAAKRASVASAPESPATLSVSATTDIGQLVESQTQIVNDAVSQGQASSDQAAAAATDLENAQTQAQAFNQDAARYQSECDSMQ